MKSEDLSRKQHDMKGALACLYGVVEAVRFGDFDFASSDGQELLEQAEAAQKLLSKEIEVCFQHLRQLEQK